MNTRLATCLLPVALFAVGTIGAIGAAADEAPRALSASFPAGAYAYAETSGLAELIRSAHGSEIYQTITASDSTRDFLAAEESKGLRSGIKWAETILRMDLWEAAEKLFGGRAAIALYPGAAAAADAKKPKPDVLVLIFPADKKAWSKQRIWTDPMLALGAKRVGKDKAPPGVKVYETKPDEGPRSYLALHKEWVMISSEPRLLQRGVFLLKDEPEGKSLAAAAADGGGGRLAELAQHLPGEHLARAFVDTGAIRATPGGRLGVPEKMGNPLGSLLFGGMLELVAHSGFACFAADFAGDEFTLQASLDADPGELDPRFGIFFAGEDATRRIPEIPGLIGGITLHRDLATWYQSRDDLLQPQVLPGFDKFETGLGNLLPGRDIGEDVIPLIGKNFTLLAALQDYGYLDGEPGVKLPGFALVFDLAPPNPDAGADMFQLFFQTLLSILNLQAAEQNRQPWLIAAQDHGGTQITYARYFEKPSGAQLPTVFNFQPAAARVGDQYIISSSLGMCEDLVDALQKPLPAGERHEGHGQLDFGALARALDLNRQHLIASRLNEGRDTGQAVEDIQHLFLALKHLGALTATGSAGDQRFSLKVTGTLK